MIRFSGDKRLLCMKGNYGSVPSVAKEFAGLAVRDGRLQKRVEVIVERLSARPDVGFPRAMRSHAEQEAFYRLMRNDLVDYRVLMEAHAAQTVERMTLGETVRVVHDTTELTFSGESQREGLGRTRSEASNGLFAHVALALTEDSSCRPLGVVDMNCWARTGKSRGNRKMNGSTLSKDPHRESLRWARGVDACESRIAGRCSAVHIMDREGDNYALFHALLSQARRFVIRLARDRIVSAVDDDEAMPLSEALNGLKCRVTREVALGRRKAKAAPRSAKTHPARTQRAATLALRSGRLQFRRPKYLKDGPETLEVNVVYVEEIGSPDDADPVSWVLVTSEPVATAEDVEAVIDHYRARWQIEELFMALKTGCAVEKRQLETFGALTKSLALFLPIAWQMLLLRAISRSDPKGPAHRVLTPTQIAVLQHYQPQKMPRTNPTVEDALLAVAGLGGHMTRNGPPGWRTLTYGMQDLLAMADAWEAGARKAMKTAKVCDQ